MNTSKEQNFISAVIYLRNDGERALKFLNCLYGILDTHFEKFELIAVNNASTDNTLELIRQWAGDISHPLTIVNMSLKQSMELCMNAGLDASIGDYIYEFDTLDMPYDSSLIFEAYTTATAGNDVVSACPSKMKLSSRIFYKIFNATGTSAYKLRSSAFRLVTRRAVNRVHSMSDNPSYRKAAYASSGLKTANLVFPGKLEKRKERLPLAIDSLMLYTTFGVKLSMCIALSMFALTIAELIYTLVVFLSKAPVEGWTTTMIVTTLGFSGLFGLITIIIKYLSLITQMLFRKQKYLTEGIEKIQK